MTTDRVIQQQLIAKGEAQGYVTYDDILALVPVAERDVEALEDLMEELSQAGITVISEPPAPSEDADSLEAVSEAPTETELEELEDFDPLDLDLVDDAGYQQAIETDDVVGLYLKEAGRVPLLTADEEVRLAKRMEAGKFAREQIEEYGDNLPVDDRFDLQRIIDDADEAQEHLVRANSRLVISVAKRYVGRGVPFLDLIQEGNIGLLRAVEKFDPTKGYKFSTYATWWIRQAITRAIADQARTIRIPVHMVETINRLMRIQRQQLQDLGREPTSEEIALELDLLLPEEAEAIRQAKAAGERLDPMLERQLRRAAAKVRRIVRIAQEPMSLETPVGQEESSLLGDFIEDETIPAPADAASHQLLKEQVRSALSVLTDREREVLEMRFGLKDGQDHTLEEVGQHFRVTRERIRQIEAKALRKLRHPTRSRALRDYLG